MINDNAKKWVEALRSGKYKQGQGALTTIHKNVNGTTATEEHDCCLGVACKVAMENGVELQLFTLPGANYEYRAYGNAEECSVLPEAVTEWLGLATRNGTHEEVRYFEKEMTLVRLNDTRHFSFAEIADRIESEPAGLFVTVPQNGSPNEKQNPEPADTVS